ncbi:FAD-dependent thymidylate synthase [Candidatus Saganbacteria bacterium]|nr:FAD-dependent thymidylate synthase [Candidatus Saganbacteria bacterium]
MKILLAGYNLDSTVIEGLKKGETNRSDVTPEVLSASYARISRDSRPIDELRADARREVEKARKSNSTIIFKMGHHSVAEHAVFNFDIIDVTRFSFEEIEKFRLCSYTEKSQRYQKLENHDLVPEEIKAIGLDVLFTKTIEAQNNFYQDMVSKEIPPEDARYITSLATLGQVGMTLNARNLELLFRRFASHPLQEIQQIGRGIYDQVKNIAPSIILFTEATPLDRDTYREIEGVAGRSMEKQGFKKPKNEVLLVDFNKRSDELTLAAMLHTTTSNNFKQCQKMVKSMTPEQKETLIKTSLKNLEFYDSPIREFEYADMIFELTISAACFGQLKRHRIATTTSQAYDPKLGVTIPKSIIEKGLKKEFMKVIRQTEKAYEEILAKNKIAAPYVLTNAHRKRVLFKCNARELYHISRLREDGHAQWDIQNISREMSRLAKEIMPLTMLTIGGKDSYPEIYGKVFGVKPEKNA